MDVDDEDLYGPDAFETPTIATKEPIKPKEATKEQNDGEDMEDVYEDDDLEIIVGPAESKPSQQQQASKVTTSRSTEEIGSTAPVMNIHAIGTLDTSATGNLAGAIPIIDADLDDDTLFEDRPWRRPGADPTDYFNFGFDEQSWREYCSKQRTLREEQATKKRIGLVLDAGAPSAMAKGLHLGPGGSFQGMLPPLPPFLPPPPHGYSSRDSIVETGAGTVSTVGSTEGESLGGRQRGNIETARGEESTENTIVNQLEDRPETGTRTEIPIEGTLRIQSGKAGHPPTVIQRMANTPHLEEVQVRGNTTVVPAVVADDGRLGATFSLRVKCHDEDCYWGHSMYYY